MADPNALTPPDEAAPDYSAPWSPEWLQRMQQNPTLWQRFLAMLGVGGNAQHSSAGQVNPLALATAARGQGGLTGRGGGHYINPLGWRGSDVEIPRAAPYTGDPNQGGQAIYGPGGTDWSKVGGYNDPRFFLPPDFYKPGMDDKGKFNWEKFVRAHADSPDYPGLTAAGGYDPTHGTWDTWRRHFGLLPQTDPNDWPAGMPEHGGGPMDNGGKWGWMRIAPNAPGMLVSDINSGLPIRAPGPGTLAYSHFTLGPTPGNPLLPPGQ